jgi:hypothetical protein
MKAKDKIKQGAYCDKCHKLMTLMPAQLLSPPVYSSGMILSMLRFCHDCYDRIMQWIREDIVTDAAEINTRSQAQTTIA